MQKHFSRLQATDLARPTGRRVGKFLGLMIAGVLLASPTAFAQPVTPAVKPNLSAEEQKIPPAPQTEEEWRNAMSRTAPPHKGCFTAAYPKMDWVEVQCATVSAGPHFPAQGTAPGNDNSFIAIHTGSLLSAIGSFESVIGATSVTNSLSGADKFSLQLNTNFFPVCTDGSFCGWQQFVFGSFGCQDPQNGNQPTDCVYIEYWLRDQSSCPQPPPTWMQITDDENRTHCIHISQGMLVTPHQPITSLRDLSLAGVLDPTLNTVTAIFGKGGAILASVSDQDFLDWSGNFGWQEAEFNVFGQDKASEASLSPNPNTTLVVRTQIQDRLFGNFLPTCVHLMGFTRETNNLHLIGKPAITVAQFPSIAFQETNNNITAQPECAKSLGDTHLMTFDGLFYDFQATGEFLLAQPAPDFIVQTHQVSGAPKWPNAAINKAVAVKMGKTSVAICLAPDRLEIDGKLAHLDKGKSLSLAGNVTLLRRGDTYFIARPSGDIVRADVNNNEYIDVYVGHAPSAKVGGLLGNANGATGDDIAIQAGSVLTQPVSFTDLYGSYADSWRVPTNQSLLCPGQKIESGKPCILDVTVIGSNNAANAFAGLTPPVSVMRVQIAGSPPAGGIGAPPGVTRPGGTPLQVPK